MKFIKALFSISKEKKFNIQKFAIDTSLKIDKFISKHDFEIWTHLKLKKIIPG